jgi:putative flavoprotein involved in K+ transport
MPAVSVSGQNEVSDRRDPERREVVVVGGGQAGLAIGYFLAQQGRGFTILEAAAEPAAAWRQRWDSLKLFTSASYNALPGLAFPGDPDRYPGRDEVVAYLADYARRFDLPVELDGAVRAIRRVDGKYLVELDDRAYEAEHVVVATGPFQVPFVPAFAGRLDPEVVQLHSTAYRSPEGIPTGACSLSAEATPASRSRRSSPAPARPICRSGRARCRCRSGSWAVTCSGISTRRG